MLKTIRANLYPRGFFLKKIFLGIYELLRSKKNDFEKYKKEYLNIFRSRFMSDLVGILYP